MWCAKSFRFLFLNFYESRWELLDALELFSVGTSVYFANMLFVAAAAILFSLL